MPKACPVCGSRKWRKDNVTGNAICEDGHVFQDFRSENLVAEATGHTLQKRTLKKGPRINKKAEGTTNQDYYRGNDAEYLKIQAFQLLLRYQIQAISKLWSLPDAFEIIVRDLWAYQLSICPLIPRPEATAASSRNGAQSDPAVLMASFSQEETKGSDTEEGESASDKGEEESDLDPDLLEKLSDKSSDSENEPHPGSSGDTTGSKKGRLRVSDTVVTLIMGLWILRYPVINAQIEDLLNKNQIPYLDFGHTTLVPDEMKKRINREIKLAISPQKAPPPLFLHKQCQRFARVLSRRFGLVVPEINIVPIAWQLISDLGGVPRTYHQVIRLLRFIDVNISLVESEIRTISRKLRRGQLDRVESSDTLQVQYERTARYNDIRLPEVSVVAAWILIMKMAYGLDTRARGHIGKDPVVGMPQPKKWVDELNKRLENKALKGSRAALEHQDFTNMGDEDVDRFLDECEQVLLKDHSSGTDDVFPLPHADPIPPPLPPHNSWTAYHASLAVVAPSTLDVDIPNRELPSLPGERVRSYDATDITGTLPESYEVVLRSAAEVVGVGVREISKVVEIFERKIEKLRPRSRNVSRAGSQRGKRRSMG